MSNDALQSLEGSGKAGGYSTFGFKDQLQWLTDCNKKFSATKNEFQDFSYQDIKERVKMAILPRA